MEKKLEMLIERYKTERFDLAKLIDSSKISSVARTTYIAKYNLTLTILKDLENLKR